MGIVNEVALSPFEMANRIAAAASYLDYLKGDDPEGIDHVDRMHDIAMQLAGDRVNEIYDSEVMGLIQQPTNS